MTHTFSFSARGLGHCLLQGFLRRGVLRIAPHNLTQFSDPLFPLLQAQKGDREVQANSDVFRVAPHSRAILLQRPSPIAIVAIQRVLRYLGAVEASRLSTSPSFFTSTP